MNVEQIRTLWSHEKREPAMSALLLLWQEHRDPHLAEVLVALDTEIVREKGPIAGKTRALRRPALELVDQAQSPLDTGRLADAVLTFGRPEATELLEILKRRAPDPRITRALLGMLKRAPGGFKGWDAQGFWARTLRLVGLAGAEADREELSEILGGVQAQSYSDTTFERYIPKLIEKAMGIISSTKATPVPGAQAWADELSPSEVDTASAMARVYEMPQDLGRRAVLADALQTAADPRGEFIALQLAKRSRASTARAKVLLERHREHWLGAIATVVQKSGLSFKRGFPVAGRIANNGDVERYAGLPEWRTFEKIDAKRWNHCEALFAPEWPLLETLQNAPIGALDHGSLPVLHTFTQRQVGRLNLGEALGRIDCPSLRDLSVEALDCPPADVPWNAPVFAGLEVIRFQGKRREWMRAVRSLPGSFSITIDSDGWHCWRYTFGPDRSEVIVSYGWQTEQYWRDDVGAIAKELEKVSKVTLVLGRRAPKAPDDLERALDILQKGLPNAEVTIR